MKVLANDGISASGAAAIQASGHELSTTKVAQNQLIDYINEEQIDVILVRSATTVRKDMIDACPSLKGIGRGGVGMDNIDVEYARETGLKVFNTPAASSDSVAELVMGHMRSLVRFMHDSNRQMPLEGDSKFGALKKSYAKGVELRGRTLGIVGFDRVLTESDFISVHVPGGDLIGANELAKMKDGVVLLNAARGGVINEEALLDALESGKVAGAGLDVFVNEPTPAVKVLMNGKLSVTPHIGAATLEAQDRIGTVLAAHIDAI
jgi:D-3-phosphoglycerate dehydrogenase